MSAEIEAKMLFIEGLISQAQAGKSDLDAMMVKEVESRPELGFHKTALIRKLGGNLSKALGDAGYCAVKLHQAAVPYDGRPATKDGGGDK